MPEQCMASCPEDRKLQRGLRWVCTALRRHLKQHMLSMSSGHGKLVKVLVSVPSGGACQGAVPAGWPELPDAGGI